MTSKGLQEADLCLSTLNGSWHTPGDSILSCPTLQPRRSSKQKARAQAGLEIPQPFPLPLLILCTQRGRRRNPLRWAGAASSWRTFPYECDILSPAG